MLHFNFNLLLDVYTNKYVYIMLILFFNCNKYSILIFILKYWFIYNANNIFNFDHNYTYCIVIIKLNISNFQLPTEIVNHLRVLSHQFIISYYYLFNIILPNDIINNHYNLDKSPVFISIIEFNLYYYFKYLILFLVSNIIGTFNI